MTAEVTIRFRKGVDFSGDFIKCDRLALFIWKVENGEICLICKPNLGWDSLHLTSHSKRQKLYCSANCHFENRPIK
jgi:hypothetical protein